MDDPSLEILSTSDYENEKSDGNYDTKSDIDDDDDDLLSSLRYLFLDNLIDEDDDDIEELEPSKSSTSMSIDDQLNEIFIHPLGVDFLSSNMDDNDDDLAELKPLFSRV